MRTGGMAGRIAVAVNGGLALYLALLWGGVAWQGAFWQADFTAFYTGYRMTLDGQGARLYDLAEQARYRDKILGERAAGRESLVWVFPPLMTVPASLLGLLPLNAAFYVWCAVLLGLLAVLVRHLARLFPPLEPGDAAFYLAALLGFPAVFYTFQMGQLALLMAVCLTGFALALRDDRDLPQAAWVVLGLVKPQLILIPCVILLARLRWRPLAWAALLFGVWAAAATLVLGPDCWRGFVRVMAEVNAQTGATGVHPGRNCNFKAVLVGLLGMERLALINALTWAGLAGAVVATLALWWRRPSSRETDFAVRLALCLQLGLIFIPYINGYDVLCYCAPLALFLTSAADRPWLNVVIACAPLLFLLDNSLGEHWPLGLRPFLLLMIAVAGMMVRRLALSAPRIGSEDNFPGPAPFP